jgi:hypothetical protein
VASSDDWTGQPNFRWEACPECKQICVGAPTGNKRKGGWAVLPEDLLLMVLERQGRELRESAAMRQTSSRWKRIHDEGGETLELHDGDHTREQRTTDGREQLLGRLVALQDCL